MLFQILVKRMEFRINMFVLNIDITVSDYSNLNKNILLSSYSFFLKEDTFLGDTVKATNFVKNDEYSHISRDNYQQIQGRRSHKTRKLVGFSEISSINDRVFSFQRTEGLSISLYLTEE